MSATELDSAEEAIEDRSEFLVPHFLEQARVRPVAAHDSDDQDRRGASTRAHGLLDEYFHAVAIESWATEQILPSLGDAVCEFRLVRSPRPCSA